MTVWHLPQIQELKVEVTRTCQLQCLHCSSNGSLAAREALDPTRVSRLIAEFADLGGRRVCISGGEPLFYESLPTILGACSGRGLEVNLYTTGISPDGGTLRPISTSSLSSLAGVGARLVFSLHGADPATHDYMTQVEGSFATTISAIEKAVDAGIRTEAHIVPTALNLLQLRQIAALLADAGVKRASWLRFVPQGRGRQNAPLLTLGANQWVALSQMKAGIERTCPYFRIRTGAPMNILCPAVPTQCTAGVNQVVVCPDGRAVPCDGFKGFQFQDELGNVMRYSLLDVWEKSRFLNAVRGLLQCGPPSVCSSCGLCARCASGCLAQKAASDGGLADGRDPDCPLTNGVQRIVNEPVVACV